MKQNPKSQNPSSYRSKKKTDCKGSQKCNLLRNCSDESNCPKLKIIQIDEKDNKKKEISENEKKKKENLENDFFLWL